MRNISANNKAMHLKLGNNNVLYIGNTPHGAYFDVAMGILLAPILFPL